MASGRMEHRLIATASAAKRGAGALAARAGIRRADGLTRARGQLNMVEDLGCLVSCGSDSAIVLVEHPFRSAPPARRGARGGGGDRVAAKRVLRHSRGHRRGVKCFAWVRSQKVLVSGGLERAIVVWNPYTGKPIGSLTGHQLGIERLEVIDDFDKAPPPHPHPPAPPTHPTTHVPASHESWRAARRCSGPWSFRIDKRARPDAASVCAIARCSRGPAPPF